MTLSGRNSWGTPNGPLLAIRADASHSGGTGHIMRTLALAQEWIYRGGRCCYISSALPEKIHRRLLNEQCSIVTLDSEPGSSKEASESSVHLQSLRPHWLLIDSYHLTPPYQSALVLPQRTRIVAISDFGTDDFAKPDLVIHPNINNTGDYHSISPQITLLDGAKYILLRSEIIKKTDHPATLRATRLLITMGGSDPKEAATKICQYFVKNREINQLKVRVILGPAYPTNGAMYDLVHPNIEIVTSPDSMHSHYEWADTAICSPSTTAFELAHYGIPTGLVITADNQEKVLESMLESKIALYLSDARKVSFTFNHINQLLSGKTRTNVATNAIHLVDGLGAKRICDIMQFPDVTFRAATEEDARDIWLWANDPTTRAASFNSKPIAWEDHALWYNDQLKSDSVIFLIIESSNGSQLGTIRYNLNAEAKNESIISISLAPEARGFGLAPVILTRSAQEFFTQHSEQTIVAWIRPENKASHQSFIRANFEDYPSLQYPDRIRMRLLNPAI